MAKRTKTDPKAEATKAVARTASRAIDSANAVGRFMERVFGGILEDTVALAGDPLRAYRLKRLADMQVKVDDYLSRKGITATDTVD